MASAITRLGKVFDPPMVFWHFLSWLENGNMTGLIDIKLIQGLGFPLGNGPVCMLSESENYVNHHPVISYFKTILTNHSYSPTNITNETDSVSRQFDTLYSSWMIPLSGYFKKRNVWDEIPYIYLIYKLLFLSLLPSECSWRLFDVVLPLDKLIHQKWAQ